MAVGGFVLLAYLVFRSYTWQEDTGVKLLYLGLMIYAIIQSYHPGQRFQFLSWMVAIGVLVTKDYNTKRKIKYYIAGGMLVLFFFSLAGVMRRMDVSNLSIIEKWELASARTESREDQNMLDGFMMVLDVYPEHLNYHYGGEHLEKNINAPLSLVQYGQENPSEDMQTNWGLNQLEKGTVGISRLFMEPFMVKVAFRGIIIFSVLYGWLFVKLFRNGSPLQFGPLLVD